jgi:hypothetical protein
MRDIFNKVIDPTKSPGLVHCDQHGPIDGYVICSCVLLFGERVQHVEPYTRTRPGEILCKRFEDHEVFEYRLICKLCAIELGLNQIGGRRH